VKQIFAHKPLLAILLLAVVLRVAAVLALGNEVISLPGTADQLSYHNLALRVLNGHGFTFDKAWWPATAAGEPTAHWSFLYTFYLVAIYAIFGPQPLVARVVQAILVGLLQPYLAYRLAEQLVPTADSSNVAPNSLVWRLFPLFAAGVTAIYGYFVYYSAALMTESFFIVTLMATLLLTIILARRLNEEPTWRLAAALGVTLSLAVLLRQLFLLLLPFLFGWLLLAQRPQARVRALAACILASAILVAAILPFTVYNYARFDRLVLLNTNAGYVLFWANHPIHGTSFIPASEMGDTYQQLIPDNLRALDEAALDQALLQKGIEYILADPLRYVQLSLSRIPAYFKFWPEATSSNLSNLSRLVSFGLFLPFMLFGLGLMLNRQRLRLATPLGLLLIFMLVYTTIHVLTWTLIRYRLPVDAILLIFAGLALSVLTPPLLRVARTYFPHMFYQIDPLSER
jgi:4-amino-4-deoxy-L-arabinose transferase-like glycosyltransferase